jgi:tripartite-type tricarboxylate transporter receptor subunit TctC
MADADNVANQFGRSDVHGPECAGVRRYGWQFVWLTLAALVAISSPGASQSLEEFYKGRQIKFVVASAGGGGYDFYSRLLAKHLGRFIPGNPTFVIQNMPGAGGTVAANYLYNVAAQDGSEIAMLGRATATQPLLEPDDTAIKFNPLQFNWIGSPQQEVGLILVRQPSPIKTIGDLRTHEILVSGTTHMGPPSFYPRVLNRLVGTKFNVVEGYASSQEALLALERGEVSGHASGSSAAPFRQRIAPWIKDGTVKVVAQIGLQRDEDYSDTPTVFELAQTDEQRSIMKLLFAQQIIAWPVVAPPKMPAGRVAVLRSAFEKAMVDKEFLEDAARASLIIKPVSGASIDQLLASIFRTPDDIVAKTRLLMK